MLGILFLTKPGNLFAIGRISLNGVKSKNVSVHGDSGNEDDN